MFVGTGSVFLCEELKGDILDFTHQFVSRPFQREMTVYNMGRRMATLSWQLDSADEVKRVFSKVGTIKGGGDRGTGTLQLAGLQS